MVGSCGPTRISLCPVQFHRELDICSMLQQLPKPRDRSSARLVIWPPPQTCLFNLAPMNPLCYHRDSAAIQIHLFFFLFQHSPEFMGSIAFCFKFLHSMPLALLLSTCSPPFFFTCSKSSNKDGAFQPTADSPVLASVRG